MRKTAALKILLLCFGFAAAALFVFGAQPSSNGFLQSVSPAYAADKEEKKSSKRKKRSKSKRRKKSKSETKSDEQVEDGAVKKKKPEDLHIEEIEAVAPEGANSKYGHKEFDDELSSSSEVDTVLVLDSSRSMLRNDPHRLRDQGAKLFIRFLSESDKIGLVQFDREAKKIFDLMQASPDNLRLIDEAIDSVPAEGGFTDIRAGILAAYDILTEQGRPNSQKAIVLLSDGKMDPHPEKGSPDEVTKRLLEEELKEFKNKYIKVYTLSLSRESDRALLTRIAQVTDGLQWYAPSVGSIHLKFSDLFLALKKPQMVPLEGNAFEVDEGIQEATFYIARPEEQTEQADAPFVTIIDPRGQRMNSKSYPVEVKWFKAVKYDIVTIKEPTPGPWRVEGVEQPEGFATLLTDTKLQVGWPKTNLDTGDSIVVAARLTEKGEVLNQPGFAEVAWFSYKIINVKTRSMVASGSFEDDGLAPDETANDGIYTATIKGNKAGEYKALIGVTAATFTRQQQRPFMVGHSHISIEKVLLEMGEGLTAEAVNIELSEEVLQLRNPKLRIIAHKAGESKAKAFDLPPLEGSGGRSYLLGPKMLSRGDYSVSAWVLEKGSNRAKSAWKSSVVEFSSVGADEVPIEEIAEEEHVEAEPSSTVPGIILLVLSGAWVSGLGYMFVERLSSMDVEEEHIEEYVVPEEVEKSLAVLRERASKSRREPAEEDLEIWALLEDSSPAGPEAETAVVGGEEAESAEDGESEPADEAAEPQAEDVKEPAEEQGAEVQTEGGGGSEEEAAEAVAESVAEAEVSSEEAVEADLPVAAEEGEEDSAVEESEAEAPQEDAAESKKSEE